MDDDVRLAAGGHTLSFRSAGMLLAPGDESTRVLGTARFHGLEARDLELAQISEHRVEWNHGAGVHEFLDTVPGGVEQTWTFEEAPTGTGGIRIEIPLGADVEVVEADANQLLLSTSGTRVRYGSIHSHDATGRELVTRLHASRDTIIIQVDDRDAEYPVTVDPLIVIVSSVLTTNPYFGGGGASFGNAIATHGNIALVGEPNFEYSTNQPGGFVHLYWRKGPGGTWSPCEGLAMSALWHGAAAKDRFGSAVAIDANIVAVGAPKADSGAGVLWVIDLQSGFYGTEPECSRSNPSVYQRIPAPAGASQFGSRVAITNGRIVVTDGAAAWTYVFDGAAWTLETSLNIPPGTGSIASIAIEEYDGSVLIALGFPDANSTLVYRHAYDDIWDGPTQIEGLPGEDAEFGGAVAIANGELWIASARNTKATMSLWTYDGAWALNDAFQAASYSPVSSTSARGMLAVSGIANDGYLLSNGVEALDGVYSGLRMGRVVAAGESTAFAAFDETVFGPPGPFGGLPSVYVFGRVRAFEVGLTTGEPCSDTECASGYCVDGVCCASLCGAGANDCQACSVAAGGTADGTCTPLNAAAAAARTCRASAGACDPSETCSPSSLTCPANQLAPVATECRPATSGGCDSAEYCTGSSATCPADGFASTGTLCRESLGPCDTEEQCTGASPQCPADVLRGAETECRGAAGVCDTAEVCSGVSPACPPDAFVPATTVCNAATQPCDVSETCTGLSAACPLDRLAPFGIECRASAGTCDLPEVCTGGSAACPAQVAAVDCDPGATDTTLAAPALVTGGSFADSIGFLYQGPSATQQPVPGTPLQIVEERAAGVFGYVFERSGAGRVPLAGATVHVLNHEEMGQTTSRANGRYDLVVNGGGALTIEIRAPGYITTQRTIGTDWNDFFAVDDALLIQHEPGTPVTLGASTTQVARGEVHGDGIGPGDDDTDGLRRATVLFPPGTRAWAVTPTIESEIVGTVTVRATEFTVGELGPEAMPGDLPDATAYTYALELSIDQADAAGATSVRFRDATGANDAPVSFYLENFIGVPVGRGVPTGWYDRTRAEWIATDNGRVIRIVGVRADGQAEIDASDCGTHPCTFSADTDAFLLALGLDENERRQLATLYPVGQELWRVEMTHFTPWDCNYPYGPPDSATTPEITPNQQKGVTDCEEQGSIVRCESQTLGERIPIAGTDLSLSYSSARVPGRRDNFRIQFPLLAPGADTVTVAVSVAGRRFSYSWRALPSSGGIPAEFVFDWDGQDAFGRTLGSADARVRVCHVYVPVINSFANFERFGRTSGAIVRMSGGAFGNGSGGNSVQLFRQPTRIHICADETIPLEIRGSNATDDAFGWSIDRVHTVDMDGALARGDGTSQTVAERSDFGTIDTLVDANASVSRWAPPPASLFAPGPYQEPFDPQAVSVEPDGSVLIAHLARNHTNGASYTRVSRVRRDGIIEHVAGVHCPDVSTPECPRITEADGHLATAVNLGPLVQHISVGHDGSIYLTLNASSTDSVAIVSRIDREGVFRTVAGGEPGASDDGYGDGGPATAARLYNPQSAVPTNDGSLYILESNRIRHIAADGMISTLLRGGGAVNACVSYSLPSGERVAGSPTAIASDPDGAVYIALWLGTSFTRSGCIARLDHDGGLRRVTGWDAGLHAPYSRLDGTRATAFGGRRVHALAAGRRSIYFRESNDVFVVQGEHVYQLAAESSPGSFSETQPDAFEYARALAPGLDAAGYENDLQVGPDGVVVLNTRRNVSAPWPDLENRGGVHLLFDDRFSLVRDGALHHRFDSAMRHIETLDALTGTVLARFNRGSAGAISSLEDADGNVVTVQRGPGLVRFVPALGAATEIRDDDGDGWADRVTYVGTIREFDLSYAPGGLLTMFREPDGREHEFSYDAIGRLLTDQSPDGRSLTLTGGESAVDRAASTVTRTVAVSTALGRTTTHVTTTNEGGRVDRTVVSPIGASSSSTQWTARRVGSGACSAAADCEQGRACVSGVCDDDLSGLFVRYGSLTQSDGTQIDFSETIDRSAAGWADALPERTVIRLPGAAGRSVTRSISRARVHGSAWPVSIEREETQITISGGSSTRVSTSTWDAATRTITSVSPAERTRAVALDLMDRPVRFENPGLADVNVAYDSRGRTQRVWSTDGVNTRERVFTYTDPVVGELWWPATIANGAAETSTLLWEEQLGMDTFLPRVRAVALGSSQTSLSYDSADRVDGVTPPGRPEHALGWTPGDAVSSYVPPMLIGEPLVPSAVTYSYDRDGALDRVTVGDTDGSAATVTPGDPTIDFVRLSDGRLDRVEYGAHTVDVNYEPTTRLLSELVADEPGTADDVTLNVDRDGPLALAATWSGAVSGSVALGYDELLQVSSITTGGLRAAYRRDLDGIPECVRIVATGAPEVVDPCVSADMSVDLDLENRALTTSTGAVTTTDLWSELGELVSRTASWSGAGLSFSYDQRDGAGRLRRVTETLDGISTTTEYQYDAGRLTHVRRGATSGTCAPGCSAGQVCSGNVCVAMTVTEQYTYGVNGNRTAALYSDRPNVTHVVVDDRDRLREYGNAIYEYNPAGQLESRTEGSDTTTYKYDLLGALRRVTLPDTTVIEYVIDGAGRRVGRRVVGDAPANNRYWLYADALRPIAEIDGTGTLRAVFVYGMGRVPELMVVPGGATYRIVTDHLGSVRRVVDVVTGAVAQHLEYDAFGRTRVDTAPGYQPFGFAGGIVDEATGLVQFGARDYDPEIGRWTARDPAGFVAGSNLYNYCYGDPVDFIDVDGENPILLGIALVAIGVYIYNDLHDIQEETVHEALGHPRLQRDPQSPGHNDQADAWRHCAWSCRAAQRYGTPVAWAAGEAHELQNILQGGPREEEASDTCNNSSGRSLGNEPLAYVTNDPFYCQDACLDAAQSGNLDVLGVPPPGPW